MRPAAICEGGVLYGADDIVAEFVRKRLGGENFDNYRALGLVHDGVLIGGVVFQNWTHMGVDRVEVVIATDSPRWCRFPTLKRLFAFAFEDLGLRSIIARTPAGNAHVRSILERLGCHLEGQEGDVVIYGMNHR